MRSNVQSRSTKKGGHAQSVYRGANGHIQHVVVGAVFGTVGEEGRCMGLRRISQGMLDFRGVMSIGAIVYRFHKLSCGGYTAYDMDTTLLKQFFHFAIVTISGKP